MLEHEAQLAHVAAIRELMEAAESHGIPLWLESGWAIDARLSRITRPHEDIDIAFPQESATQYRQLIESLGYGGHKLLDYGFLSWRGDICLDSEPCHCINGQYSFVDFPAGSCPDDKEGTILGFPVCCVSWEAIYFEILGYIRDIPRGSGGPRTSRACASWQRTWMSESNRSLRTATRGAPNLALFSGRYPLRPNKIERFLG